MSFNQILDEFSCSLLLTFLFHDLLIFEQQLWRILFLFDKLQQCHIVCSFICDDVWKCTECASVSSIPRGEWYCQICQHTFLRERPVLYNADAVAAGRVEGVDPIEEIAKRCIRIVKDIGAEIGGCVLCRWYLYSIEMNYNIEAIYGIHLALT